MPRPAQGSGQIETRPRLRSRHGGARCRGPKHDEYAGGGILLRFRPRTTRTAQSRMPVRRMSAWRMLMRTASRDCSDPAGRECRSHGRVWRRRCPRETRSAADAPAVGLSRELMLSGTWHGLRRAAEDDDTGRHDGEAGNGEYGSRRSWHRASQLMAELVGEAELGHMLTRAGRGCQQGRRGGR